MAKRWLRWVRALWVLLMLNSVLLFGLTLWVTFQFLEHPSERLVQGLNAQGLPFAAYATFTIVSITILFLVYLIVSWLIFFRRPEDGFALFTSIFLLGFGATNAYPQFVEFIQFFQNQPWWYAIPSLISTLSSWTLLVPFLVLYPDGHFVPRWAVGIAIGGFVITVAWGLFSNAFSDIASPLGIFGAFAAVVLSAASFYVQFRRYQHYSSPLQRQQTKWFVLALAIFAISTILTFLLPTQAARLLTPAASVQTDLATMVNTLGSVFIPLAVGIAILRYRLWDIDILIRKTLTYSLVLVLLAVMYFGSVILLQQVVVHLTGLGQNEITTVLSTLAIAALFIPLRDRVQNVIDQRFYRTKYDAQQVLNDFANTVRDETDLEQLTAHLIQVVDETMQPTTVTMWLKEIADNRPQTAE